MISSSHVLDFGPRQNHIGRIADLEPRITIMLRAGSGGKLGFGIGAGTNTGWYEINTSTSVLSLNTWHHVAATYDGSKLRAYVDGNLVDSILEGIKITEFMAL